MRRLLLAALFLTAPLTLRAEVVEYHLGDTITVPTTVNQAGRIESIRTVVLLGVAKASIKGTWSTDDCEVILNGNTVRVALLRNAEVPIGVLADNGLYYHIVVKPYRAGPPLSPVITVIAATDAPAATPGTASAAAKPTPADTKGVVGGSWEHETNLVIKLHKHIRGGRTAAGVIGSPKYNQQVLRDEGKRVPGLIWHEDDDWKVAEYYEWTLGRVHAHYIGVTYRGRDDAVDFNYQQQVTDNFLALWHQPVAGERQFYTRKLPQIRLLPNREEFFIEYTSEAP